MILSIDPGVTTGLALLRDDGSIVSTTTVGSKEELETYFDLMFSKSNHIPHVVAEQGPKQSSNYRAHIQEIEEEVKTHFPDVTWVQPSQWKNHPVASSESLSGLTQHEKDAVGLGRWFRKTSMNERPNAA